MILIPSPILELDQLLNYWYFKPNKTWLLRNEKGDYILDVYLSSSGHSFGELYTDNGVSLHTISHDQFLYVKFNATQVGI